MKAIYAILAVVGIALIAVSVFSEKSGMSGWYTFEEGKKISEEKGKKMFVFIGTDTCSICKRFKTFFSSNETAMEFIKENFVPVYVDALNEKPPVTVTFVPVFCIGLPENLSCFSTDNPQKLMQTLKQTSQ